MAELLQGLSIEGARPSRNGVLPREALRSRLGQALERLIGVSMWRATRRGDRGRYALVGLDRWRERTAAPDQRQR